MNSSMWPLKRAFLRAKQCHLDQSMMLDNESSFSTENRQNWIPCRKPSRCQLKKTADEKKNANTCFNEPIKV